MIYTVQAFWVKKQKYVFYITSNFLIFVLNRFAMLHVLYKQLWVEVISFLKVA